LECTIDIHGYGNEPEYYVALKSSILTAHRGYPEEVKSNLWEPSPEAKEKLKKFCEEMKIPWQDPKWYLASYWG
jgi:hypothetical protein